MSLGLTLATRTHIREKGGWRREREKECKPFRAEIYKSIFAAGGRGNAFVPPLAEYFNMTIYTLLTWSYEEKDQISEAVITITQKGAGLER